MKWSPSYSIHSHYNIVAYIPYAVLHLSVTVLHKAFLRHWLELKATRDKLKELETRLLAAMPLIHQCEEHVQHSFREGRLLGSPPTRLCLGMLHSVPGLCFSPSLHGFGTTCTSHHQPPLPTQKKPTQVALSGNHRNMTMELQIWLKYAFQRKGVRFRLLDPGSKVIFTLAWV